MASERIPEASDRIPNLRRLLSVATVVVWAAVAAPVIVFVIGSAKVAVIAGWALSCVTFLATVLASLAVTRRSTRLALLGVGALATVVEVLLGGDGLEGLLLVLIAAQLGGLVPRRAGIAWVVLQSTLQGAALWWHWRHWNARTALLLMPAYGGFQLLALFMAEVIASTSTARGDLERINGELSAAQHVAAEHTRLAERVRIARELHDAIGHQLTALGMHLEVAGRLISSEAGSEVAVARELARSSLAGIRDIVERLRDDERLDVVSALRTLAEETLAPRVHMRAPDDLCRDDPERALAVLRCTQEIVTNARRHASADNLWVTIALSPAGMLEVSARDDGTGAEAVVDGNGLRGMRERIEAIGGQLEITTAPGRGFQVRALIPARRS
jgi:signal transduction histidine kinase